jgi:hypothetical protein
MKRDSREFSKMKKQRSIDQMYNERSFPLGKYRKRNAMTCKPRCLLCRRDKIFSVKTYKDLIADLDFEEQKSGN